MRRGVSLPRPRTLAWLLAVVICLSTALAAAHAASDGYLTLRFSDGPFVVGQWDLAVRDIDSRLPLASPTGAIGPEQVLARKDDIMALALSHLGIRGDGRPCQTTPGELAFTEHAGAIYVELHFTAACQASPRVVVIDYTLFFDKDPLHRGLTHIEDGAASRSIVFSAGFQHDELTRNVPDHGQELRAAVRSGISHIASGVDHLLFLLALLLPAVLRFEGGAWRPVATFREAALEVAKIVTAFTVAHSLTLSLAVLDLVRLPSRIVEPAIAASIVVAAVQNLVRPAARGRWKVAFALGLLHGFGFSAVLVDLGLRRGELATTLFGFNVGVELGQLAVVLVFLPIAFRLRRWTGYPRVVLGSGSVVIAVVASVWFVQRVLLSMSPA
jgi:hypothetical protein